jgi:hypothetical protein
MRTKGELIAQVRTSARVGSVLGAVRVQVGEGGGCSTTARRDFRYRNFSSNCSRDRIAVASLRDDRLGQGSSSP